MNDAAAPAASTAAATALPARPLARRAALPGRWFGRNARVTAWAGPVLVATGVLAFVLPPALSPMSSAAPYNVFHIAAGLAAVAAERAARRGGRAAALPAMFNAGFGAIDCWQAIAGVAGIFPAGLFALGPGDHLVHLLIGPPLLALGLVGLRAMRAGDR